MRRPLVALVLIFASAWPLRALPRRSGEAPSKKLADSACQGPGLLIRESEPKTGSSFEKDAGGDFAALFESADPPEEKAGKGKKTGAKTWKLKPKPKSKGAKPDPKECEEQFTRFRERYGSSVDAVVAPSFDRQATAEEQEFLFSRVQKRMDKVKDSDVERQKSLAKLFDGGASLPEVAAKFAGSETAAAVRRQAAAAAAVARAAGNAAELSGAAAGHDGPLEARIVGSYGNDGTFVPTAASGKLGQANGALPNLFTTVASPVARAGGYSWLRPSPPPDNTAYPVVDPPIPTYVPNWAWNAYQASRIKIGDTIGSLGLPWNGALKDGVPLPSEGDGFKFVRYGRWGTSQMINGIQLIAKDIKAPDAPRLLIGDISYQNGGPIRRHKSHQSGRDVDIFFASSGGRFDVDRNLRLAVSAVRHMNVTNIFVDQGLKAHLARHARNVLATLSDEAGQRAAGQDITRAIGLMSHEPGHGDHFHIRIQ